MSRWGGETSTGSSVDAEAVWTVQDSVIGETFEIAQFQVEEGGAAGFYTLSEQPLIEGRSYRVLEYDSNPNAAYGDIAFSYEDYADGDFAAATADAQALAVGSNEVEGSSGNDVIDAGFTDAQGDRVDEGDGGGASGLGDAIDGLGGDDSISAGDGADTVQGGAGHDTISGGAGDDTIYGDGDQAVTETLNWTAAGADGSDISGGFTQDTGGMQVDVSFERGPIGDRIEVSDRTQYTGTGEAFDTNSALYLTSDGSGSGMTATTTLAFSPSPGAGFSDGVENVSFRINDIDSSGWTDVLQVQAYDADGNPVPVTITASGNDTVSGDTVTATWGSETPDSANGSALVEIGGPVARLEITYSNADTAGQAIWISDVHFDAIPAGGGDDVIDGGAGDDLIYGDAGDDSLAGGTGADTLEGGTGNDSLTVAQGDSAAGGDGDDTFLVADLDEAGSGDITVTGGEGDESAGDTLDFQGLIDWDDVTYTDTDDANGGLAGYATLADGSVVNFSEIENVIICFAAGTRILTPHGPRRIEDLRPGDLVITADDGLQPVRWTGRRTVPARGRLAPVRLRAGSACGNGRDLLVSPQHRMLLTGHRANLLFGESEVLAAAKHLIDGRDVIRAPGGEVTYVHLLFDRHQVIFAEGAPSESFHPGAQGLEAVSGPAREELFSLFPELRSNPNGYGGPSRICLKRHEARLLAA
ncbi:MAG: Hint domain-containing protein [Paracoccaceae bacterium]